MMEELVRESVIELEENKRYIVIDKYNINDNEYVLFINEEKPDDEDEEIYILRLNKDEKGVPFFSEISDEEVNEVLSYMYSLYEMSGIYKDGKVSFEKAYEMANDPHFLDKYKIIKELEKKSYIDNELNTSKEKLGKAKALMEEYNDTISIYKNKTESLESKNKGLQENNEYLQQKLNQIPSFLRKMFIKDKKMLK